MEESGGCFSPLRKTSGQCGAVIHGGIWWLLLSLRRTSGQRGAVIPNKFLMNVSSMTYLDKAGSRVWDLVTGQSGSASALWRGNRYQGIDRNHLYPLMRLLQKTQRESPGEKDGGRGCKTE